MLSATDLRLLRREYARAGLPDWCAILRATVVRDSEGGQTQTWATVGDPVPCRVDATLLSRTEQRQATGVGALAVYQVSLPWDVEVRTTDRLGWTDNAGRGHTLEVVQPGNRSWQAVQQVLCSEIS